MINYFGTSLDSAGHYLWDIYNTGFYSSRVQLHELPFNPDALPLRLKGQAIQKGYAEFYNVFGYSIWAIYGSCKDERLGTKSVFFLQGNYTAEQLKEMILTCPTASKVIKQMPFTVNW